MGLLLGIDSGQTLLKAVVFDEDGTERGSAARPCASLTPQAGWAECDAALARRRLFDVIPAALAAAGVEGDAITAVGIAGHGDGLYLVAADGEPSRAAILSIDTRAQPVLTTMRADGSLGVAVAETGQPIFAASLAPLARWLLAEEPDTLRRTRWLVACKDWLRLCLTGEIATDFADGNSCVATMDGLGYSQPALAAYGLTPIAPLLPPMRAATEVAGAVLPRAAAETGLRAGTPVAIGTHDVVASTLGLGAGAVDECCAIAGTFGMNLLVSGERVLSDVAQSRPCVEPGQWVVMAGSPSSVSNFEWYVNTQMTEVEDPIGVANAEVARALGEDSRVLFHPFLYGGPLGQTHGNLLGMRGWQSRRHVLRAIWEGVVFNHGTHLDALRRERPLVSLRLGGGAAKSAVWAQLFADGLGCTVRTTGSSEPGALGAAMLAGVATGVYPSLAAAQERCVRVATTYEPERAARGRWQEARARYDRSVAALQQLTDLFD